MNNKGLIALVVAALFITTVLFVLGSRGGQNNGNTNTPVPSSPTGITSQPTGSQSTPNTQVITSFEECIAAGNPAMESYPRQCRANGQTFVEVIDNEQNTPDLITVSNPRANQIVSSPLTVSGQARGNWYFEASFPVYLYDATGKQLAVGVAQAQGEWMTENFVPFSVSLTFAQPTTATGELVLEKSNASGLPENDDELRIPVRFR